MNKVINASVSRAAAFWHWEQVWILMPIYLFSFLAGCIIVLLPWTILLFCFMAILLSIVLLQIDLGLMYLLISFALIGRTLLGVEFETSWSNSGTLLPFYVPFLCIALFVRMCKDLSHSDLQINKSGYVALALLFSFWGAVSLIWAENKWHGILFQTELFLNVSIFIYCMHTLKSELVFRKIMWFWILFALLVAIFGIIRSYVAFGPFVCDFKIINNVFLRGIIGGSSDAIRRISSINNPNSLALFLNLSIAVTLGIRAVEKNRYKICILSLISIFFIFTMLLTGSKAGLLSFFSLGTYLLIVYNPFRRKLFRHAIIFFSLLIILIVVISVFLTADGENRITGALSNGVEGASEKASSFSSRFIIWHDGWSALVNKSVGVGLGSGGFTHHCSPHPHAHNIYLSILFDFGPIGLFLLMLFFYVLLQNVIPSLRRQNTTLEVLIVFLSSGLIAIAVHGIVDHMYSRTILWVYTGMVASASLVAKEINKAFLTMGDM